MRVLLFALVASSLAGGGAMAAPDAFGHFTFGPDPQKACAKLGTQTVAPDGVRFFKRLDQLPWGVLEHAVLRTVNGCPVREIRYQGQTYYVTSANPGVEKLDPAVGRMINRPDAH